MSYYILTNKNQSVKFKKINILISQEPETNKVYTDMRVVILVLLPSFVLFPNHIHVEIPTALILVTFTNFFILFSSFHCIDSYISKSAVPKFFIIKTFSLSFISELTRDYFFRNLSSSSIVDFEQKIYFLI